jgi:O-antigen ligase
VNRLAIPWRLVGRRLSGSWFGVLAIVATGILLGQQYLYPNKRTLAVVVAAILVGIAWRVDMLWGVGVVVLTVPYPRGTVFGNSNVALILVLLVIWLLRVTQSQSLGPRRTPVDLPVAGLLIAYIVSFYNVGPQPALGYALQNTQLMVAGMLMFYLIVSNVRTEAALKRFHLFQIVAVLSIMLLSVYELNHPGQDFIPGWISFRNTLGDEFNRKNVRVGGPFFDYELMAEFTAISLLLVVFVLARATTRTRQVMHGGLTLLTVFILFATVTRGAIMSLAAAVAYMLWIMRRRVRFVPLVIGASVVVALFLTMNLYVANYTRSGDLFERVLGSRFVGVVPENRLTTWTEGFERFLRHPIIGHGPHYEAMTGTRMWYWPHNGYLYVANLVGIVGLTFYLWLVGRLLWLSRPIVDSLRATSYASAFLIVGHVQLVLFLIDQMKIDFLRNEVYSFEVWIMLAGVTAAWLIQRDEREQALAFRNGRMRDATERSAA